MARAYRCDRCGEFFAGRYWDGTYDVSAKSAENPKDLCPKCNKQLDEWMENKADFVPKEGAENDILESDCSTDVSGTNVD